MWIARFAHRDEDGARFVGGLDLALCLVTRVDVWRTAAAAPAGQRRQCLERRPRSAKVIDESAKGARTRHCGANAGRFRAATP
jgi:hypothetical protein